MIDLVPANKGPASGPELPDVASPAWEETTVVEDRDGPFEPEPEPCHVSPLEWYLRKLLEPCDEAPQEKVPCRDETPTLEETAALPRLEPADSETVETPRLGKPLWQMMEEDSSLTPPAGAAANTAPPPVPTPMEEPPALPRQELSKLEQKVPRRFYPRREKTGGRQKLMAALIPVLAFTLVFVLKYPLASHPATVKGASTPANKQAVRPAAPDIQIAWQIPASYEIEGRDPMRAATAPVPASPGPTAAPAAVEAEAELTVTGILYSADKPAAIVDTQVVHEGQQVSGATVEKIDRDGVQFERSGRRWKQTINQ